MATYTFYPQQETGVAPSFETFELDDDQEAAAMAQKVMSRHQTCHSMLVCCGDREVSVYRREAHGV